MEIVKIRRFEEAFSIGDSIKLDGYSYKISNLCGNLITLLPSQGMIHFSLNMTYLYNKPIVKDNTIYILISDEDTRVITKEVGMENPLLKNPAVIEFNTLLDQIGDTYERKNSNYGSAIEKGINRLGLVYTVAQLFNKYQRFENLAINNEPDKVGESIEDTLLDMAVYALETVRVLRANQKED